MVTEGAAGATWVADIMEVDSVVADTTLVAVVSAVVVTISVVAAAIILAAEVAAASVVRGITVLRSITSAPLKVAAACDIRKAWAEPRIRGTSSTVVHGAVFKAVTTSHRNLHSQHDMLAAISPRTIAASAELPMVSQALAVTAGTYPLMAGGPGTTFSDDIKDIRPVPLTAI